MDGTRAVGLTEAEEGRQPPARNGPVVGDDRPMGFAQAPGAVADAGTIMMAPVPIRVVRSLAWRFDDLAAVLARPAGVIADEVGSRRALTIRAKVDNSSPLTWPLALHLGEPEATPDAVEIPLGWETGTLSLVLPSFEGRLEATERPGGVDLALTGSCQPAVSWADGQDDAPAAAADWFDRFVDGIEARIAALLAPQPDSQLTRSSCRLCQWAVPPQHCHGQLVWDSHGHLQCDVNGPACLCRLVHPASRRPQERPARPPKTATA